MPMLKYTPILQTLSENELKGILKKVVWDYNITPADLLAIFNGEMKSAALDQTQLHAKLLNSYSWHQLIKWFGFEKALNFLSDEAIRMIFPASYRQKLLHAKEILRR
jgi:hypothetical protein